MRAVHLLIDQAMLDSETETLSQAKLITDLEERSSTAGLAVAVAASDWIPQVGAY
jgi:hypothetical protein